MKNSENEHVRGMRSIPDGRYWLSPAMDDALRTASGALPRGRDRRAHPAFAFVMALGGMGADIGSVCAQLGVPFDTGALLGRCSIALDRPILVDQSYDVSAALTSMTRKSSRRFGATDHLCFVMRIAVKEQHFAMVELTMIVPVAVAGGTE